MEKEKEKEKEKESKTRMEAHRVDAREMGVGQGWPSAAPPPPQLRLHCCAGMVCLFNL